MPQALSNTSMQLIVVDEGMCFDDVGGGVDDRSIGDISHGRDKRTVFSVKTIQENDLNRAE
jgi:hypothetical protein